MQRSCKICIYNCINHSIFGPAIFIRKSERHSEYIAADMTPDVNRFEVGRTRLRVFSNSFPSSVTSVCLKNSATPFEKHLAILYCSPFQHIEAMKVPRFCRSTRPWTSDRASVFELQEVLRQASRGYNGYNGYN